MPYRRSDREQDWLLPPSLGELLAVDHPVRFVGEWVERVLCANFEVNGSELTSEHELALNQLVQAFQNSQA